MLRGQVLVVRVYRFRRDTGAIAGMLEAADGGNLKAFHSFRELRQALLGTLIKDSPGKAGQKQ